VAAVLLLSMPSAVGVARALEPTRGLLAAVAAAGVPGGLSSWPAAVRLFDPLGFLLALIESAPLAGLAYALASLLHRLAEDVGPAMQPALAEQPAPAESLAAPALAWAREDYPSPKLVSPVPPMLAQPAGPMLHVPTTDTNKEPVPTYRCRHCGAEPLTKVEQLSHGRRHAAERRAAQAG
jgi:hypothetical protein